MAQTEPHGLIIFRNGRGLQDEEPAGAPPSDYLKMRLRAERSAARKATSVMARDAHRALAKAYAALARES